MPRRSRHVLDTWTKHHNFFLETGDHVCSCVSPPEKMTLEPWKWCEGRRRRDWQFPIDCYHEIQLSYCSLYYLLASESILPGSWWEKEEAEGPRGNQHCFLGWSFIGLLLHQQLKQMVVVPLAHAMGITLRAMYRGLHPLALPSSRAQGGAQTLWASSDWI